MGRFNTASQGKKIRGGNGLANTSSHTCSDNSADSVILPFDASAAAAHDTLEGLSKSCTAGVWCRTGVC